MNVEGVEGKMDWLEDTVCICVGSALGKSPKSWDLRSIGNW